MDKAKKITLPMLLSLLSYAITVIALIPFSLGFSFYEYAPYKSVAYAFCLGGVLLSAIIFAIEIISLSFDKTAIKVTVLLALLVNFISLSSFDFGEMLSFFGLNWWALYDYINPFIQSCSLAMLFYFSLCFMRKSLHVPVKTEIVALPAYALLTLSPLFEVLSLPYIGLSVLVVSIIYMTGALAACLADGNSSENFFNGQMVFFLFSFSSISVLSSYFSLSSISPLFGFPSFFLFIPLLCFIFVYLNFIIGKMKKLYELEGKQYKKEHQIKLKVSCFQCFDVFLDGELLSFPSKKSKEFFALLVLLNGKELTMEKAITYLYPDKDLDLSKISYRDIIWKLKHFFLSLGYEGITFKRGKTDLDVSSIECDYYEALKDKSKHKQAPLCPEYEWSLDFENELL